MGRGVPDCRMVEERYPGCMVRAYGSLVRANAWTPRSGIDLAVTSIPRITAAYGEVNLRFRKYED